ncbi:MAG: hypothetical protein ACR2MC_07555 [Actinomycetota bacterium]
MKRVAFALPSLLLVASVAYLRTDVCSDWQEQYKRFLYAEMMKNSPLIFTEKMIEEITGERPAGCGRPSLSDLSNQDSRRYRREVVGPNEFAEEQRAASRQSSSSPRAE